MDRDAVMLVLIVALIANTIVIGSAFLSLRRRRRAADSPGSPVTEPAAAVTPLTATPTPSAPAPTASAAATVALAAQATAPRSFAVGPSSNGRVRAAPPDAVHGGATELDGHGMPGILVDTETGLASLLAWEGAFVIEERRLARYHRASTIIVAELDGLDVLAERLGQEVADRLVPPVADAMRRNARHADLIARVGPARFNLLLPETDEFAARHYVERVRAACDMWLEAGAVAVSVAIGLASPSAGGTLGDALLVAEERMQTSRRTRASRPRR